MEDFESCALDTFSDSCLFRGRMEDDRLANLKIYRG